MDFVYGIDRTEHSKLYNFEGFRIKSNLRVQDQATLPAKQLLNHLQSTDPYQLSRCKVTLKNRDLWTKFHAMETEMIITKSGRRMFPSFHVQVSELDPNAHYCVLLEMTPASRCRYKYSTTGGWAPAGTEEAQSPQRIYLHPESPAKGDYWMSQPISFGRLKLTNTPAPPAGQVVLSSMHKYQPRVIIAKTNDPRTVGWAPSTSVAFPETQFIAVTAYQNEKITQLKIDNNPFAKGFRENGQAKCKRKRTVDDRETAKLAEAPCVKEEDSISVCSSPNSSIDTCKSGSPVAAPQQVDCCQSSSCYTRCYAYPYAYEPHYFYHRYPVYPYSMWNAPSGGYYYPPAHSEEPRDMSALNLAKKPRKLTDFSIKTILGC
ncbi:T-box transcription factor TBX2-like [Cylas formicarius]|uniref:T-box transcription factor TBX2-like n=1 Tax=Cylas formicarius TaxID=197179 RepID=UPI0029584F73|nr:T-box transcription factor TBX2-like [Cylas formicarius]